MNGEEFNSTARRIESEDQLTFDVRPFDTRQREAVDSYLRRILTALEFGLFGYTKPITLVCTPGTAFSDKTIGWLTSVKQRGVIVELRQVGSAA